MNKISKIMAAFLCFLLTAGLAMAESVQPIRMWKESTGSGFPTFLASVIEHKMGDAEKIYTAKLGEVAYVYAKSIEGGKYLNLVPAEFRTSDGYSKLFREKNGLTAETISTRDFRIRGQGKGFWLPVYTTPSSAEVSGVSAGSTAGATATQVATSDQSGAIATLKADLSQLTKVVASIEAKQNPQMVAAVNAALDRINARFAKMESEFVTSNELAKMVADMQAEMKDILAGYLSTSAEAQKKFEGVVTGRLDGQEKRLTTMEENIGNNAVGITVASLILVVCIGIAIFLRRQGKENLQFKGAVDERLTGVEVSVVGLERQHGELRSFQLRHTEQLNGLSKDVEDVAQKLSPFAFDQTVVSAAALRKLDIGESLDVEVSHRIQVGHQVWVLQVKRLEENKFEVIGASRQDDQFVPLFAEAKFVAKAIRLAAESGRLLDSALEQSAVKVA